MTMQKQQLRARMKALRAACEDRGALDNGIFENLFSQPFMNAETFFVYVSFGSEADTRRIIEELFKRGKTVFLPRVAGQRMQCVRYVGQALEKGAFGIMEPQGDAEEIVPDVCLTPLLAADRRCARLGYGGGYYDRFFMDKQLCKVGLAYSFQIVNELPAEPTDVFLDAVVTEREVLYRR